MEWHAGNRCYTDARWTSKMGQHCSTFTLLQLAFTGACVYVGLSERVPQLHTEHKTTQVLSDLTISHVNGGWNKDKRCCIMSSQSCEAYGRDCINPLQHCTYFCWQSTPKSCQTNVFHWLTESNKIHLILGSQRFSNTGCFQSVPLSHTNNDKSKLIKIPNKL